MYCRRQPGVVQLRRSVSLPHKLPEVISLSPFVTGAMLVFSLILPLGVQNLFIFSQGANHRRLTGALPAVVTASLADTALIVTAVSGASLLLVNEPGWQRALALAGVLFLLFTVACIGVSWIWFAGLAAAGHLLRRTDHSGRTAVWLGRGSAVLMWLIAARLLTALLVG